MKQDPILFSPVYQALSKPVTFLGVDYDYFMLAGALLSLIFIYGGFKATLIVGPPLHLIGFVLGIIDPHVFKLILIRANFPTIKNRSLWGCQTYEAA